MILYDIPRYTMFGKRGLSSAATELHIKYRKTEPESGSENCRQDRGSWGSPEAAVHHERSSP
jgi:hypothetical protein